MLNERNNSVATVGWPADMGDAVGRWNLVRMALEAIQRSEESDRGRRMLLEHRSPSQGRMLLTLLIYCYARGWYGSEDIEEAIQTDKVVRYLSANNDVGCAEIRKFRRQNRQLLQVALASLLELACDGGHAAWVKGSAESQVGRDTSRLARIPVNLGLAYSLAEADQRIVRAIQLDSMAMDQ